jgi:hypothetical protein
MCRYATVCIICTEQDLAHSATVILLGRFGRGRRPLCSAWLWVAAPFAATVRGIDASGERFEAAAVIQALGTGGLDMRLSRPVTPGARLFAVVRLSTKADTDAPMLRLAACGRVVDLIPQPDRWYRVALAFRRYRLLYSSSQLNTSV